MTVMLHTEFIAPRITSNHLSVSKPPYLLRPLFISSCLRFRYPHPYHQHPDFDLLFQIFNGAQLGMFHGFHGCCRGLGVGWCLMCASQECRECEALPRSGITCLHFLIAFRQSFPMPQTLENPQPPTPASSASFFSSSRTETIS